MTNAPRKSVKLPGDDAIELPPVGVRHQPVQLRAPVLRSGDADAHVLPSEIPATAIAVLPQLARLQFRVLRVESRNPAVDCSSHRIAAFQVVESNGGRPLRPGRQIPNPRRAR